LLTLDTNDIGGNSGKKAALKGYGMSKTAYLSQEFAPIQTGTFNVSCDIYIDRISVYTVPASNYYYNRTGLIFIGNNTGGTNSGTSGPCSTGIERFVCLAFYDKTPGDSRNDIELRARTGTQSWYRTYEWTIIATNLSYDSWYTLKLEVDVSNHKYNVYVNDILKETNIPAQQEYTSNSITHISFSVGGTARGDFYLDNIFSLASHRKTLSINVEGNGYVTRTPGESTYQDGSTVILQAIANAGWTFHHWAGNLTGSANPTTITMNSHKTVIANFTKIPYTLTTSNQGNGTITKNPDALVYHYNEIVQVNAVPDPEWSFHHWAGDLSGNENPKNILINGNKTVIANFSHTPLLQIRTNFDSGNIGSYSINGNTINLTLNTETLVNSGDHYTYWTNFKVLNTLNKEITFRVTNANLVPFLANTAHEVQMVYSYDGTNWSRLTNHTYAAGTYTFWKNFTTNQVQIATFFPFSYSEMQDYLETVNASEWATTTTSLLSRIQAFPMQRKKSCTSSVDNTQQKPQAPTCLRD
jgi:hypothetical protein